MTTEIQSKVLQRPWLLAAVGIILFIVFSVAAGLTLPAGVDWHLALRPAAVRALTLQSPYLSPSPAETFGGPPWALLPLLPLALLPVPLGRGFLFALSLGGFAFGAHRLGAKPLVMLAFLLSPPVMHCLLNANLDWLPILGYSLSPWLGLFFITVKPQMGSVVGLLWLVEAWREGGGRRVLSTFAPGAVAFALSLAVNGFWPANMAIMARYTTWWNASLWPASIPVGLALAVAALRLRNIRYAMGASPCLSPQVLLHSWSAALAALFNTPIEFVAAVVGLWLLLLVRVLAPSL